MVSRWWHLCYKCYKCVRENHFCLKKIFHLFWNWLLYNHVQTTSILKSFSIKKLKHTTIILYMINAVSFIRSKFFNEYLFSCKDSDLLDINKKTWHSKVRCIYFMKATYQNVRCAMCWKIWKNNKFPGNDCFTVDFLKLFRKDFKHYIVSAVNHIFAFKKEIPISQRLVIITYLLKGDKPRQFLEKKILVYLCL